MYMQRLSYQHVNVAYINNIRTILTYGKVGPGQLLCGFKNMPACMERDCIFSPQPLPGSAKTPVVAVDLLYGCG
jgi:hypothetical protein